MGPELRVSGLWSFREAGHDARDCLFGELEVGGREYFPSAILLSVFAPLLFASWRTPRMEFYDSFRPPNGGRIDGAAVCELAWIGCWGCLVRGQREI